MQFVNMGLNSRLQTVCILTLLQTQTRGPAHQKVPAENRIRWWEEELWPRRQTFPYPKVALPFVRLPL